MDTLSHISDALVAFLGSYSQFTELIATNVSSSSSSSSPQKRAFEGQVGSIWPFSGVNLAQF